jgi:hypothetical protein
MFTFTPTNTVSEFKVPYFEDARADFAPYYTVKNKTIQQAQAEVANELGKLGAGVQSFQAGKFQIGKKTRYGFNIRFMYGGSQGIIRVAGLPMRSTVTKKKIEKVQIQALMNVRDWLKSAITSQTFSPGSDALIPYMLVDHTPGQEKTVADYIATMQSLPIANQRPDQTFLLEAGNYE